VGKNKKNSEEKEEKKTRSQRAFSVKGSASKKGTSLRGRTQGLMGKHSISSRSSYDYHREGIKGYSAFNKKGDPTNLWGGGKGYQEDQKKSISGRPAPSRGSLLHS